MRKLLIVVAILLVIVAAAVTVAPEFIDWNAYRGDIAAQIERQTGRKVTFGGDLGVTLLPAPALVAKDVRLSNIEGAGSPDMVALRALELRIAPGPLLTGRLHFASMRLVEPVVSLEITADGRRNWDFGTAAGASEAGRAAGAPGQPGKEETDSAVRFDNVLVEKGVVLYRDARSGATERFEAVNATFGAASLEGPLDGDGSFVYRGVPVGFEVALGHLIQGRTVPLSVVIQLPAAQARANLSGAILGLGEKPRFKGELKSEGRNFGAVLDTIAQTGPLPPPLLQPFALETEIVATADKMLAERALVRLGDTKATVRLEASYAENIDFSVAVDMPRLDLDAVLALRQPAPAPAKPSAAGQAPAPSGAPPTVVGRKALGLPENIHGMVDVAAEAITYRDGIIGQLRLSMELSGEELVISQLSAQLPGGSEAAVFGVANMRGEVPRFEGELDVKVDDLRRILRWAGVADPQVDPERLRSLTLRAGQVVVEPHQLQLGNINAKLDATQITGGIAVAMRARPSFGAALEIDRLNLDAYLPRPPGSGNATGQAGAAAEGGKGPASPAPEADTILNPLRTFGAFDCNVRIGVKQLTVRDAPIRDVRLDASLLNGVLAVREFSTADLAGATVGVKGGFDASAAIPEFKALSLSVKTQDPDKLFRFFGLPPTAAGRELGAVATTATLDGRVVAPRLQASLQARDMDLTTEGEFAWLPAPGLDMKTRVRHKDFARLVRTFGYDYRPAAPLGAIDVTGRVRLTPERISIEGLNGQIGPARAEGSLSLTTAGARPKLTANLRADTIEIDKFLPPKRNAALDRAPGAIVPASFVRAPRAATAAAATPAAAKKNGGERWSREPLDLSGLHSLDADVKLVSRILAYGPYRVEQADMTARLAQGVLRVEQLTGKLFGGALVGQATLEAVATPQLGLSVTLKDGHVEEGLRALTGSEAAGGSLDLDATIAGVGTSEAQMVGSLLGQGSFAVKQIDVRKSGAGLALAPALEVLRGLDALGGLLGNAAANADLTGTFKVEDGVAHSDDLKLASTAYEASAKADVDLARWQIKSDGQARLKEGNVDPIPFTVTGPLDAPDVKISPPENVKNFSIRVPEKLLKDKDARRQFLENLKKGVLGN